MTLIKNNKKRRNHHGKIISVIFKVESEGYQSITELKKAPVTDDYTISQAALVKKENGPVRVLDSFDTGIETVDDTVMGSLIGGFLGILGGPIGMLLSGSLGALTGSVLGTGDAVHNVSLIKMVTQQLVDGEVVLIALEQEVEEDAAEVAEEVERAVITQREMKRQAREQLRNAKKAEFKQKVEEHRAKLSDEFDAFKAKFKKE